jgi:hypothetical protein
MPTQANLPAILEQQRLANNALIRNNTTCDKSYTCEYKNFVAWVKAQPELTTPEAPFLTRNNVDHYFTRVISSTVVGSNTSRRVMNALNWYGNNREHIGVEPKFDCASPLVEDALRTQRVHSVLMGGTAKPGSDPHMGLKDILPEKDKLLMMDYIYRTRNDWGPASVNFTWGQNGAVRGASNRNLTLCDLNLSYGFGPERNGPLSRALLLVMRKGKVHKDRHETDKQVCCWRHKNYKLCSVFSTAAYVIWNLTQNPTINFLHENKKEERASWWDTPLIDWEAYNGEYY